MHVIGNQRGSQRITGKSRERLAIKGKIQRRGAVNQSALVQTKPGHGATRFFA